MKSWCSGYTFSKACETDACFRYKWKRAHVAPSRVAQVHEWMSNSGKHGPAFLLRVSPPHPPLPWVYCILRACRWVLRCCCLPAVPSGASSFICVPWFYGCFQRHLPLPTCLWEREILEGRGLGVTSIFQPLVFRRHWLSWDRMTLS